MSHLPVLSPDRLSEIPQAIVKRICLYLLHCDSPASAPNPGPHVLVSLAVSCHSLSGIALDVLWHTLSSPWPLFYTLPSDLWAFVPDTGWVRGRYGATLLRDPVPGQDFTRFVLYSKRIKRIAHHSEACRPGRTYERVVSPHVWDTLLLHGPRPLLPCVQSLSHAEHDPLKNPVVPPLQPAELFFGRELRTVNLQCIGSRTDPHRPTEIVENLSRVSPLLERLNLEASLLRSRFTAAECTSLSGPAVGRFHHLAHFSAYTVQVEPDALVALGSLPRLQYLLLRVDPEEYTWDALPHERHADFFPALTQLVLQDITFEWCVAFLRVIAPTSLRKLHVFTERGTAPAILFEALCASIGGLPCGRSLQKILISADSRTKVERVLYGPSCFAPLLVGPGQRALRCIAVWGRCELILDDFVLDAIARAWPDIERIRFPTSRGDGVASFYGTQPRGPPEPGDPSYPQATLAGLAALVRRCPRLSELSLPLDMRVVPELGVHPTSAQPPAMLTRLYAAGSVANLNDQFGLASFLCVAFPRLSVLECISGMVEVYHKKLGKLRQQERKWGRKHGRGHEWDVEAGPFGFLGHQSTGSVE